VEAAVLALQEHRADLLDHPVVVGHALDPALLAQGGGQLAAADRLTGQGLPATAVHQDRAGEVELAGREVADQVLPDEEGEAEHEQRLALVAGDPGAHLVAPQPPVGVEGVAVVAPEGGHADDAGGARSEAGPVADGLL
jgi:hypothetical protein